MAGPLHAYGLIFEAGLGAAQQERRKELVSKFELVDLPIDASGFPPFRPEGPRGLLLSAHDPGGDFYREAFGAAAVVARQAGVSVLFTGFGGDEMVALRGDEQTRAPAAPSPVPWLGPRARRALSHLDMDLAPPSPVPMPALMAFAARNPALIQLGIWPVAPLSDPRLVRFGDSLPVEWRRNKRILRDRLRSLGLSANVVEPGEPENFLPLMERGLRDHGLPWLRRMLDNDSILVGGGFVDRALLAAAHQEAKAGPRVPDLMYDTITVEVGLRSLIERWRVAK